MATEAPYDAIRNSAVGPAHDAVDQMIERRDAARAAEWHDASYAGRSATDPEDG